ncbi:hypothetical protein [Pedobacter nanyangensis]|uniref:hypothetical protein n=1 Tax=Pedobacter nanyangensis TaxID=1562389 RepID=UPI0013B45FDB|nr:hypothetical protein [Pedobacter nanyangensis]
MKTKMVEPNPWLLVGVIGFCGRCQRGINAKERVLRPDAFWGRYLSICHTLPG